MDRDGSLVLGNLQGHSVDDELHGEVLSVGGHAVPDGRASGVVLAELVDQVPHDCRFVLVHYHCVLYERARSYPRRAW